MTELESLCEAFNIRADFRWGEARRQESWAVNNWRVTLKMARRQLTCDFFGGACVSKPTVADVIRCLCLDALAGEMDFGEFCICRNFGHDEDSREAERYHALCVDLGEKVRRLLGEEFEMFASAEH